MYEYSSQWRVTEGEFGFANLHLGTVESAPSSSLGPSKEDAWTNNTMRNNYNCG